MDGWVIILFGQWSNWTWDQVSVSETSINPFQFTFFFECSDWWDIPRALLLWKQPQRKWMLTNFKWTCDSWSNGNFSLQQRGVFRRLWWVQDGAPAHRLVAVKKRLAEVFGNRVIALYHDVDWPPESLDLTSCDFFSLGLSQEQSVHYPSTWHCNSETKNHWWIWSSTPSSHNDSQSWAWDVEKS